MKIVQELLEGLRQSAGEIAPRFFSSMPQAYFHDSDQGMRLSHIKAIIAAEASGLSQTLILRNTEGTHYTFISDRSYPDQLSEFVQRLPPTQALHSAKVYTATDDSRILDVFELGERASFDARDTQQKAKLDHVLDYIRTERITRYLGQQGVDIQRAYLDSFEQQQHDVISLLSFLVTCAGEALDPATTLSR